MGVPEGKPWRARETHIAREAKFDSLGVHTAPRYEESKSTYRKLKTENSFIGCAHRLEEVKTKSGKR
jgi:hypothetical protein